MDSNFLPANLIDKCGYLVRSIHKEHGLNGLPRIMVTRDYMVALACMSDTFAVMQTNVLFFRLMIASLVAAAICLVLCWVLPWSWMLFGVAACIIAAVVLHAKQGECWGYLGIVCLGTEILANDYCGWGTAYPDLRDQARKLLNDNPARPKTTWLDFYLPRRESLAPEVLQKFGPGVP